MSIYIIDSEAYMYRRVDSWGTLGANAVRANLNKAHGRSMNLFKLDSCMHRYAYLSNTEWEAAGNCACSHGCC